MQATGSFNRDSPPVIPTGIQGRSVVVFDYLPQESNSIYVALGEISVRLLCEDVLLEHSDPPVVYVFRRAESPGYYDFPCPRVALYLYSSPAIVPSNP